MKRLGFILAAVMAVTASTAASALEIESGGLRYEIDPARGEATVVSRVSDGVNRYSGEVIVPEAVHCGGNACRVSAIGAGAFAGSGVTLVQLPNTVTRLGEAAFAGARELQGVTLPLSLNSLPARAFAGTALRCVALPEGMTTVGARAFDGCASLHTLLLPSTLDSIGDGALDGCYNLFEVYAAGAVAPRFAGCADVSAVDVIVPAGDAVAAFEDDETWGGDSDRFVVWAADEDSWYDIAVGAAEVSREVPQSLHGVSLAGDVAFKVLDKWGEMVALTAAPRYYVPQGEMPEAYTIVPTVLTGDLEAVAYTVPAAPVVTGVSDEMYPLGEPRVVVHDGNVYINGLPHDGWVRVFDIYGQLYFERPAAQVTTIGNLPSCRAYIVMVGDHATKISL